MNGNQTHRSIKWWIASALRQPIHRIGIITLILLTSSSVYLNLKTITRDPAIASSEQRHLERSISEVSIFASWLNRILIIFLE